jgi:hypothetical protein
MIGGGEEPSTPEPLCRRPALCMQAFICCFALSPHTDGTVTHHYATSLLKCLPYFPRRCPIMNSPISRKKLVTTPVKLREEEGPRLEKALPHLDEWLLQDGAWTWWQNYPHSQHWGPNPATRTPSSLSCLVGRQEGHLRTKCEQAIPHASSKGGWLLEARRQQILDTCGWRRLFVVESSDCFAVIFVTIFWFFLKKSPNFENKTSHLESSFTSVALFLISFFII